MFNKKAFAGAASTLIMFIAVISVTTGVVIAFVNYVENTQDSLSFQSDLSAKKLRTSITITNMEYNSSSNLLYVYIKNIGQTNLDANLLDLYVDGSFRTEFNVSYASNLSENVEFFEVHDTVVMIDDISLNSGTHDIKVRSEFGVGDDDTFNI